MSASTIYESYEEIGKRYIPPGSGFCAQSFPETEADMSLEERFRQNDAIAEVKPLFAVHAEGKTYTVSRPIKVRVFREGDLFFAENETLLVCGTGDSAWDAVEELELHVIHFYKYYKELPSDRVIGQAKRLKSLYENLLIEEL
jgi:hypothetical protein